MLKIVSLTFKDIINNLNFSCQPNTINLVTGKNGCGKTTLLNILNGNLKASGEISWKLNKIDFKVVELVPDTLSAYLNLSVQDNFEFFSNLYNNHNYNLFGLEKFLNYKVKNLSKGYQQKLNLALSLLSNPEILLLDEPNANLDKINEQEFYQILKSLKDKMTIIITAHHFDFEVDQRIDLCSA